MNTLPFDCAEPISLDDRNPPRLCATRVSINTFLGNLVYFFCTISFFLPGLSQAGDDNACCCCYQIEDVPPTLSRPNAISLGPEYYYAKRTRKGGTSQTGNAFGVRLTYDYIKRYCFYAGFQAFYGSGILNGHTGADDKIRSRLTDALVEGSLGYTFQMKSAPYFAITPYAGYGYFHESNKFTSPSPLPVKFTTYYRYFAYGFLSSIVFHPCFKAGFNARFRSPWQTRCKVSDDPDFDDIRQRVGDRVQYRLELPLTYTGNLYFCMLEAALVPFYEQRLYGARENYPFDFFETKYKIIGLNLQVILRF